MTYHNKICSTWLMASENMKFTVFGGNMLDTSIRGMRRITYLPHNAEYLTLTIISVGSTIVGMGRSSMTTLSLPLNTTAFIVVLDILTTGDQFDCPER